MKRILGSVQTVERLETRNGPRVKVVCRGCKTGHPFSVWGSLEGALSQLRPGDSAIFCEGVSGQLELESAALGKESEHIPSQPSPPPDGEVIPLSPERKRQIASYVDEMAKVYGYCLSKASSIKGLTERDARAVAATLYISTRDKFDL